MDRVGIEPTPVSLQRKPATSAYSPEPFFYFKDDPFLRDLQEQHNLHQEVLEGRDILGGLGPYYGTGPANDPCRVDGELIKIALERRRERVPDVA